MIGSEDASELFLDGVRATVAEHGVAIIATEGFAYTVGLTARQHPELLVCGLSPETAHAILNAAARLVLAGRVLAHGDKLDGILDDGYQLAIAGPIDEDADEAYPINVARALFEQAARPLQVVYPDAERRFPWDAGYSMTSQPLLADAPGPEPATGPAPAEPLSAREREIARLVADGLTNTQIANRLHLTSRAVTVQVGRLYRKTAIESREQLRQWVKEQSWGRAPQPTALSDVAALISGAICAGPPILDDEVRAVLDRLGERDDSPAGVEEWLREALGLDAAQHFTRTWAGLITQLAAERLDCPEADAAADLWASAGDRKTAVTVAAAHGFRYHLGATHRRVRDSGHAAEGGGSR